MRIQALLWLLICAVVLPAAAPADAPEVDDLVDLALRRAPAIAAMEARLEAARERIAPAGALPDPAFELMIQNEGFPDWTVGEMPMSMIGPQLSQAIPFPGKRSARREAARAEARVGEQELEALRRAVAREVRVAYAQVYALDREAASLDAGRELLDLLAETVAQRQRVGESDQEAMLKTRLARSRLEERARDLVAERAMAVAALNGLLDLPVDAPFGVVASLPRFAAPSAAWDSLALKGAAELAVREAEAAAAVMRLRAARADARPDFMAGAGVGLRGSMDPVVTLRLGMELPLWSGSKQRPLVRAAQAEEEAARADLRQARAGVRAEAARLLADFQRAEEQILRYEESFLPQTSLAFQAARSAYLAGRGDFSTVLEDMNLWLEARAGLARREADRFAVLARLDALTAPAPTPGNEGDSQ